MPDPRSETRTCPYCKEEVIAAAVRCKHCFADIAAAAPAHGGVCPLCQEEIRPDAIRCKHCKADLVRTGPRRPARIHRRRPPLTRTTRAPRPVNRPASADSGSSCPEFIDTPYGTYHLVDEGTDADGWHVCGYEPGYGVFEDGEWMDYTPS